MQQYFNQQYFSEQAPTFYEAEKKAREKYGDRLTILQHETVKIRGGFLNLFHEEGVKITGLIPRANRIAEPLPPPKPALDFAEEKEKILALAGKDNFVKDNVIKEVLAEVRGIKERLESQGLASSREEHPTLNRLDDVLILNDFSPSFRKVLLDKARKEISLEGLNNYDAVQNKILEWIGESVKIYDGKFQVRPRIMILVGPTGVGKTTTVAKLAANFGIDESARHKRKVALITIDAYRIGAKQQLETYVELMEFPCSSVGEYDELKKAIALYSDNSDLILIDTIGKSPRDMAQLGKMKMLLDACGTLAEIHLVISATTKSGDLKEILNTFEPFNYRSVIVTKIDETIRVGNVISALSEKAKTVSYITNGQKVPADIMKASVIQFLINLEGFKVNRIRLEEKFPDKGQEQMQQWR